MRTVGVRELKNQASKIVRAVREEHAEYVITVDGRPVAVLRPFNSEPIRPRSEAEVARVMADLRAIADEVETQSIPGVSGVEALIQEREERWRSLTQA